MTFGRAYSNVFDGTKRLGSAKAQRKLKPLCGSPLCFFKFEKLQDGWMVLQGAPRHPQSPQSPQSPQAPQAQASITFAYSQDGCSAMALQPNRNIGISPTLPSRMSRSRIMWLFPAGAQPVALGKLPFPGDLVPSCVPTWL